MNKRFIFDEMKNEIDYYGTELMMHEKKCNKIFNDIIRGKHVFLRVERNIPEDESESMYIEETSEHTQYTEFIRISLLTEEMIEYDIEMFEGENRQVIFNRYRPYFVSFIVPLEENIKRIKSMGDEWYRGRFLYYEKDALDNGILLNGILETSASPVNYFEGKLLVFANQTIKKSILDKINNTYDPNNFFVSKNSDIEQILNGAWAGDFPQKIDIYNVGHGNSDYIRGTKHRILYDVGYNYRSFPGYRRAKYLRAARAIRHFKPSCVILSHWDLDHIIGCAYAEQNIFSKKWIAPSLVSSKDKKATPNSIRLAHYLKVLGNLCLVDRDQGQGLIAAISCAKNVEIKLWLGGGKSILTPKNREGLILEITDSTDTYPHILLAGDVPYQCMPNTLSVPIDFMHVPHHCSNMELGRLRSMSGKGVCAIISTNRKRTGDINYDEIHRDELMDKFEHVFNTIDNPLGDEVNLSIQIDYRRCNFRFRF